MIGSAAMANTLVVRCVRHGPQYPAFNRLEFHFEDYESRALSKMLRDVFAIHGGNRNFHDLSLAEISISIGVKYT